MASYQNKVIRRNDTRYVSKANMSLLKYEFATEDGLTPSSCEIRLGDIDPMTGQPITDESVFKGYYQCVNQEVRVNLKQIRLEKTKEERRKTNELKARLSARFEQEHGYKPNEDNLRLLVEQEEGSQYFMLPLDSLRNEDGESYAEILQPYSEPFEDPYKEEPLQIRAMREVGESLTGTLKVIFDKMSDRFDAGATKVKRVDLADELDVSPAAITKALEKIAALIKAKTAELAAE